MDENAPSQSIAQTTREIPIPSRSHKSEATSFPSSFALVEGEADLVLAVRNVVIGLMLTCQTLLVANHFKPHKRCFLPTQVHDFLFRR